MSRRVIEIGSQRFTKVVCVDLPGAGGACHKYIIESIPQDDDGIISPSLGVVHFQNGPIKENGVNGCHQEDLIAIVIDRLQHFQKGDFACRDNEMAIVKLEEALMWLNKRTSNRIARGVEGTSIK